MFANGWFWVWFCFVLPTPSPAANKLHIKTSLSHGNFSVLKLFLLLFSCQKITVSEKYRTKLKPNLNSYICTKTEQIPGLTVFKGKLQLCLFNSSRNGEIASIGWMSLRHTGWVIWIHLQGTVIGHLQEHACPWEQHRKRNTRWPRTRFRLFWFPIYTGILSLHIYIWVPESYFCLTSRRDGYIMRTYYF